jgi:hypothetical protein
MPQFAAGLCCHPLNLRICSRVFGFVQIKARIAALKARHGNGEKSSAASDPPTITQQPATQQMQPPSAPPPGATAAGGVPRDMSALKASIAARKAAIAARLAGRGATAQSLAAPLPLATIGGEGPPMMSPPNGPPPQQQRASNEVSLGHLSLIWSLKWSVLGDTPRRSATACAVAVAAALPPLAQIAGYKTQDWCKALAVISTVGTCAVPCARANGCVCVSGW